MSLTFAQADDLATFNIALEDVAIHNRAAMGYLRSDNVPLAHTELDYLRASWGAFSSRFGSSPPERLRDNPQFTQTLVDVPMRAVAADLMLNMGRADLADNSLQAIRVSLSTMRHEAGLEVLADCVLEFNKAASALAQSGDTPPDWLLPETASDLSARAEALGKIARHCDALAGDNVRNSAEFRKLIDGIAGSLALMPKIIETKDDEQLRRVLRELRELDEALALHYG
jgi:hypothetical protein